MVVEKGATVNNAIIMQGCKIKSGAVVENAIVTEYGDDAGEEIEGDSEGDAEYLYISEGHSCRAYKREDHNGLYEGLFGEQFDEPIHSGMLSKLLI